MTRNTMRKAGFVSVETTNGGKITSTNAMSDESKKAQRTFMFSGVTAVTPAGDRVKTTKGRILGDAVRNDVKQRILKFAEKL